ncbi:flavin-dependent oxidoreductase [Thalassococcus sp. S3]|uniref:flavin-dependent oxidoreductase n=1 Tax=Thalassococcus sp. S3 TaxID=2017482 RepID=UPI001024344A|nr:flavin-dependent oxidoreductase [Thalassococcus sp. S3]QBF34189.1 flavin-dependent oxidoreductase [Thalassococcus sp. S3]
MTVLIAGGGIAGLTLGLTLHQIGVPFRIFEAVRELKPLGVGINIQPNAVRELMDLGLGPELDRIGVRTRQYGFYSKLGKTIWEEPRGTFAGYDWPQYSIHRGRLQMLLYEVLCVRAGAGCVETSARAIGFEGARLLLEDGRQVQGDVIVAADGIHSAIRAQMVPDEGAPIWDGAILWRGTSMAKLFFGGGAMVLIGHDTQRLVAYPISEADEETGLAEINWIAELRVDPSHGWKKEDWNRGADLADFAPDFADWRFDWLDVPALIAGAQAVYEYPMVDRDPLEQWTHGPVTLMGDAAHPTYPVGSNGASQAIMDARMIGAKILHHGVGAAALEAYEAEMRPLTTGVINANRGAGPDAILQKVEDLCGGRFERIDDVISQEALADHAARYKAVAGFSIEALNARPRLIAEGARF